MRVILWIDFCPPVRLRQASAVFVFKTSLNDFPPAFLMLLSVRIHKGLFVLFKLKNKGSFDVYFSNQVEWVLRLISVLHSMMLLLCLWCCYLMIWWEWKMIGCWLMSFVCRLFLCLPLRFNLTSVLFDFNISLNEVAPLSPILLPIDLLEQKQVDCKLVLFACIILYSPSRSMLVSDVFVLKASLNETAPVSPMPHPISFIVIKTVIYHLWRFGVKSSFCNTDQR